MGKGMGGKGKGKGAAKDGPPQQPPSGWNLAAYTWTFYQLKPTESERKYGGSTAYFRASQDPKITLHVHLKLNQNWHEHANLCWGGTKKLKANDGNYTNRSDVKKVCKRIKTEWAIAFNENNKKKKKIIYCSFILSISIILVCVFVLFCFVFC